MDLIKLRLHLESQMDQFYHYPGLYPCLYLLVQLSSLAWRFPAFANEDTLCPLFFLMLLMGGLFLSSFFILSTFWPEPASVEGCVCVWWSSYLCQSKIHAYGKVVKRSWHIFRHLHSITSSSENLALGTVM